MSFISETPVKVINICKAHDIICITSGKYSIVALLAYGFAIVTVEMILSLLLLRKLCVAWQNILSVKEMPK